MYTPLHALLCLRDRSTDLPRSFSAQCTTVCRLLYCFDITFEDETLPLRQTLMEALNPARDAQVRQVRPAAICFTPRKDRQLLGEQIQMSCDE